MKHMIKPVQIKKNLEKLQIYLQNEMITVITRVP